MQQTLSGQGWAQRGRRAGAPTDIVPPACPPTPHRPAAPVVLVVLRLYPLRSFSMCRQGLPPQPLRLRRQVPRLAMAVGGIGSPGAPGCPLPPPAEQQGVPPVPPVWIRGLVSTLLVSAATAPAAALLQLFCGPTLCSLHCCRRCGFAGHTQCTACCCGNCFWGDHVCQDAGCCRHILPYCFQHRRRQLGPRPAKHLCQLSHRCIYCWATKLCCC